MSNPAQGAVGAETMTAGQVAFEAFCNGPQAKYSWHAGPDAGREPWERVAAAVLKHAALASPRADSDERTAGEIKATQITLGEGLVDITRIDHEGRAGVLFRPRKEHIAFGEPGELPEGEYWPVKGDVVLWVSGEGPGVAIKALADLATPAQPAGAVPDSLRRAFATFDADPGSNALYWHCHHLAYGFVRTLLASHPAGQSAGSGAEDAGLKDAIAEIVRRAEKDQTFLRRTLARMRAEQEPAPDSTRTGQGEATATVPVEPTEEMWRAFGTLTPEAFRQKWAAALAARPAAPEAQGAWRPISTAPKDGTEFAAYENGDVYRCHWKGYGDDEGRWFEGWFDHVNESLENPTHWCSLENLPAPPASSGQGGR